MLTGTASRKPSRIGLYQNRSSASRKARLYLSCCIIPDIRDETRWGFVDLSFDPRRMMIVRVADLERSGFDP